VRQGARAQDWSSPIQASSTRPHARSASPEGSPTNGPMRRCVPWKGRAIPCGTRLALAHLWGSESQRICETGHYSPPLLHRVSLRHVLGAGTACGMRPELAWWEIRANRGFLPGFGILGRSRCEIRAYLGETAALVVRRGNVRAGGRRPVAKSLLDREQLAAAFVDQFQCATTAAGHTGERVLRHHHG